MSNGQRYKKRSAISHTFQCLKLIVLMSATILAQSSDRNWRVENGKVKFSENCKFLGGVYNSINDVSRSYRCDELCLADERCTHFTYSWGTRKCSLQNFDKYVYPIEEKGGPSDSGLICAYIINRV